MSLTHFTMQQLIEAGLHYGHQTRRWNPKMAPYIYGVRNGIHIINLQKTAPLLQKALTTIKNVVAQGGRVLFVGTKQQASARVKESATKCGQYYINHRWLGGLLTNWKTVNQSLKRLREMEAELANPEGRTKKEILKLQREKDKLDLTIGGIRDMGSTPDVLFILDTNKDAIAVEEARRLKIPVVAIVDSNSNPEIIQFPIPGNDDAIRAIDFVCELVVAAVLEGLQAEIQSGGIDIGASGELPQDFLVKQDRRNRSNRGGSSSNPSNQQNRQQQRRPTENIDLSTIVLAPPAEQA